MLLLSGRGVDRFLDMKSGLSCRKEVKFAPPVWKLATDVVEDPGAAVLDLGGVLAIGVDRVTRGKTRVGESPGISTTRRRRGHPGRKMPLTAR